MVTAGWQTSNIPMPESRKSLIRPQSWTKMSAANNPFETYPFIFQLSDGRVIHVGNSEYASVTDILT